MATTAAGILILKGFVLTRLKLSSILMDLIKSIIIAHNNVQWTGEWNGE